MGVDERSLESDTVGDDHGSDKKPAQPEPTDPLASEARPPRPPVAARVASDLTVHDYAFPRSDPNVDRSVNVDAGAEPATVASANDPSEEGSCSKPEDSGEGHPQQGAAAGPEDGDTNGPAETAMTEGTGDPPPPTGCRLRTRQR